MIRNLFLLFTLIIKIAAAEAKEKVDFEVTINTSTKNVSFKNISKLNDTIHTKAWWFFGDGLTLRTTSLSNVEHHYITGGNYNVNVKVFYYSSPADSSIVSEKRRKIKIGLGLYEKLQPIAGLRKLDASPTSKWQNDQVVEASFFKDSDGFFKVYYTGEGENNLNNTINLIRVADLDSPWVRKMNHPVIGMGFGGAPLNRRAHSSWVGKLHETYYCFATNGYGLANAGEDRCVYMYKGDNDSTFIDGGKILGINQSHKILGYGNTCILVDKFNSPVMVHGKYHMYVEAMTSPSQIWEIFHAESSNFNDWTITDKVSSLQITPGAMYGGGWAIYNHNNVYLFYQYGAAPGNLPTYLALSKSEDLLNFSVVEAPYKVIDAKPFPNTDQVADPAVIECDGKVYHIAEYTQNNPVYRSQIRLWIYNGSFENLINNKRTK